MKMEIEDKDDKLRYILGDIRDYQRLVEIMENVDYILHTAALKNLPVITYNPFEAIETNIIGMMNLIKASSKNNVKKIVFISSDKACSSVNLYGATKFIGEQLMQYAYVYKKEYNIDLVCCRYGNVAGSTGSIIPIFKKMIKEGKMILPLTDINMSRFWFTVDKAINLIMLALKEGKKQDIFIPKLKSFYVKDLIKAMDCEYEIIGNRGNEKLSELMINQYENYEEFDNYYILNPNNKKSGLIYDCENNEFMIMDELKEALKEFE
jgi:FlaA1/EpsC-like NDP-sugar epimerase